MIRTIKFPKNIFNYIVLVCAIMIVFATFEALRGISNVERFNALKLEMMQKNVDFTFNDYKGSIMTLYLMRIIPYIGFALNSLLSYIKIGYSKSFIVVWAFVLLGTFILHLINFDIKNGSYYIYIIGFISLLVSLVRLNINLENKKEE